jgi:hypothetical protein
MNAETTAMTGNCGQRIVEPLYRINKLIPVLRICCVEIQSPGVTQVPLSDEISEDSQLI